MIFRLYVIGFMVLLYYGKLECTGFLLMFGRFLMGVLFGYAWVRVLGYKAFGLSLEWNW